MITRYTLTQALKSVGNAELYVGDPFVSGGMTSLGAIEGRSRVSAPQNMNRLTAPELTGDVAHAADVTQGEITITVPLISDGDLATLLGKISPTGVAGGGGSSPTPVFTTSVLLIPRKEIGGGLQWDAAANAGAGQWARSALGNIGAGVGAAAAPKAAIWLWRAFLTFGELPYVYENGGKQVIDVTATAMWYEGAVAIPDTHRIWTAGDPRRVGVAIPVIL